MDKPLTWVGRVLAAILLATVVSSSCGANLGLTIGDDPWFRDVYLENGDRRDNYVYYNGTWHYRGFGTPYYWDYYYR